jgi:hypothetical protein
MRPYRWWTEERAPDTTAGHDTHRADDRPTLEHQFGEGLRHVAELASPPVAVPVGDDAEITWRRVVDLYL